MSDLQRIENVFGSVPEYLRQSNEHEEPSESNDIIATIPMSLPYSEYEQSVKDIMENATELAFYTVPLTVEDKKYDEKFCLYKLNDKLYELEISEVLREITIKSKNENDVFKFFLEAINRFIGSYISEEGKQYIKEAIDARVPDIQTKGIVIDTLNTSNIEIALTMVYGYETYVTLGGDTPLYPALKDNIHAFITAKAFDPLGNRDINVSLEKIPVNIDMFGRITVNPAPCLQTLYNKINKNDVLSKDIICQVSSSKSVDYVPSKYKHYLCEYNIDDKMKQSLEFVPNITIKEVIDQLSERCLTAAETGLSLSDINIYEIVPYQEPQLVGTMDARNAAYVPLKKKADVDKIYK